MTVPGPAQLDAGLRDLVREVVREEVRAALAETLAVRPTRNHDGAGYLSIAHAAAHADVAPGTLRRWIRTGRLQGKRAGRVYRVSRAELEGFLARGGRAAATVDQAQNFVGKRA